MSDWIKENNEKYVNGAAEPRAVSKVPKRKLAVVTCSDARLNRMLPDALGIGDGDAVIIRNAGGYISDTAGESMRALAEAVLGLGVNEVAVVAHTDCSSRTISQDLLRVSMVQRGIPGSMLSSTEVYEWFSPIPKTEDAVRSTVELIREHPLIPADVRVRGYVMDVATGELSEITSS